MKIPAVLPGPSDIIKEGLIVVAGAMLAALIMSKWPWGRAYIKAAWKD